MSLRKISIVAELSFAVLIFIVSGVSHAYAATSIYIYPATVTAPRGSYQSVTAIIDGVNNKTVTWSTTGGTLVGTNPCVVNEPCTIALYTTTPGTYTVTATSNASPSVTAKSTITITGSPTPVTTHPRLGGITAAMLPALQAKAVSSNPMYETLYNQAVSSYNTDNAIWSWSCNGGTGQPSSDQTENYKEGDGYLFAFMSMIDPNDPTYDWGCYGRDIWMYYANFWLNPLSSSYSSATLAERQVDANYGLTGNHGADSTEYLTLTPDWLMAGGYLSASDLATTRAYFAMAAQQMISIAYTGVRAPVGNYNSSAQFNTGNIYDFVGQRAMGNNYTESKIMFLTAAALTFNDNTTDDPPLANTCGATRYQVCPDGTAGSLHAYFTYLTGGMLYKDYAHLEDPNVSWQAYQAAYGNLPTQPMCEDSTDGSMIPCFGDGRDGESTEGSWYQYSMYRLELALLSIQSAGYDDPMIYGPQMSLDTSSWWDLKANSDLSFLTYSYYTPQPRFAFISTGDTLQLFRAPSDFNTEAWMMVNDSDVGRTDRTAKLEWPLIYTSIGGISDFYQNLANGYGWDNAIPLFLALPAGDPTANPPADPRPSLPTDTYSANNQHILVRSGWDANGPESASWGNGGSNTMFSYLCQNSRIDHEHETCGSFDVLSDGEYITKQRTVFNDYNMMLATAEFSNLAGYLANPGQTVCVVGVCFEWQAVSGYDTYGGGQLWHGQQAGRSTLYHAEMPNYVAAIVDTTGQYNGSAPLGWGSIDGVTAASRSLIYLRGTNQVIYYDRGASTGAWNKRLWINATGPLTITGSTGSWPTRSGKQEAYYTSLLPAGAVVSNAGAYETNENGDPGTSDWEPYTTLQVDAGTPTSTQFLSVLQWGASGYTKAQTTLVQSTGGMNFDGALVGSSLVMFMRNWPATFTSVTYPASGATTQYVSDLTPNTTYSISGTGAPTSGTTDTAGVLVFSASGTGIITVSASGVVVDTTPPTASITSPTSGATVSNTITVAANASDNVAVASVQFRLDGVNLGAPDTSAPYTVSWNTASSTNGTHTLSAIATDSSGNQGTSQNVTVTVSNTVTPPPDTTPPSVPTNLTVANITSSTISLSWTASTDNVGVTGYYIYRGGTRVGNANGTSYVDTGLSPSTAYTYTVAAYDAAGNVSAQSGGVSGTTSSAGSTNPVGPSGYTFCANENGTCSFSGTMSVAFGAGSSFYYLTLTNGTPCTDTVFGDPDVNVVKACFTEAIADTTPPTTSITSPGSGATVSGAITVSASASDNVGVTSVGFYVDGTLEGTDTSAPYTFSLNTASLSNGSHTLSTKAYDAARNVGTSPNVSVTVSNTVVATTTPPVTPPSSGGGGGGGGGSTTTSPSVSITSVSVSDVTQTSANVTVTTNVAASIVLKYGPTTLYGKSTAASPSLSTNYENLTGLTPNTIYDFVIIATPAGGTSVTSNGYTLKTLETAGGGTSSSSSTPAFTENIAYGDSGSEVTLLQQILYAQGFLPTRAYITGYFGVQTEHALLLFQTAHDLNKSGFVDVQTQALLNKIVAAGGAGTTATAAATTTTAATTEAVPATTTTTTTTSGTLTENLAPGDSGSQVTILQTKLNALGLLPANDITGYYGSLTEAAVKTFQTTYGIVSYGSPSTTGYGAVGPKTRAQLNEL